MPANVLAYTFGESARENTSGDIQGVIMILCLQHVPFETPGYIATWAKAKKLPITVFNSYKEKQFPDVASFEMLVIMGGPMSVHDEGKYPWLIEEKRFIYKALREGKKLLGVCLGAQLIASVLGSRVYKNRYREIGWFEVDRVPSKSIIGNILPESFQAFHWHGETFDIPHGAVRIAKSDACPNQAFVYDEKAVGFQFHLEITGPGVTDIVCNCRDELIDGEFIQSEKEIIKGLKYLGSVNKLMSVVLEKLFR